MDAILEQVRSVTYGMWRKKWYGLAAIWLVCAIGWIAVGRIPDRYEASARIYVDTNSVLPMLLKGSVGGNIFGQVDAMRRTLISRPNLEKVIRRVDLHLMVEDEVGLERLVNELERDITISSQGADLFRISYVSGDARLSDRERAELARRVVQNLIAIFFESNIFQNRNELTEARRFLDERIAEYERQLEEAERRRAKFEQDNLGFLPRDQNYAQRLQQARQDLAQAGDEIQEAQLVREELKRQLAGTKPVYDAGAAASAGSFASPLAMRIASIQQQIDALRLRGFTDKHPDVVSAQGQLDMLRQEEKRLMDGSDTPLSATSSPLYEEIRLKLVDVETNLASLQGRRAKLERQVNDLLAQAQTVPEIEAEMLRLDRDYNIVKRKYEQLLASREEARIIQDVDTKTEKVNFRIIDPPEVPRVPVAPKRERLLTLVLVLGLAAGGGTAFLLSQLRTTYFSARSLREAFALPVLGTVSAILSDQQRGRRRLEVALFCVGIAAVFISYGLVILFELRTGAMMA
ncbi:MAG: XrtA system polysaccharide chain length determinant [Pseudomonadota bacterium]